MINTDMGTQVMYSGLDHNRISQCRISKLQAVLIWRQQTSLEVHKWRRMRKESPSGHGTKHKTRCSHGPSVYPPPTLSYLRDHVQDLARHSFGGLLTGRLNKKPRLRNVPLKATHHGLQALAQYRAILMNSNSKAPKKTLQMAKR